MTLGRVFLLFIAFISLLGFAGRPAPLYAQQTWTIQTFAGGGPNGVVAKGTAVGDVSGIATDSAGTVFISSSTEGEIWDIANGNLNLVAGSGVVPDGQAYSVAGDAGPALQATIFPGQIAFDRKGNYFIPDPVFNRVRKVDSNGIITLLAGDGVIQNDGTCLYDGDGPATQHTLCQPTSVAVDRSGNLYISEYGSNRVRKVDNFGNMTTFAGSGAVDVYGQCVYDGEGIATAHALCKPENLTFDRSGNLYIADLWNQRIRKVDSNGNISTVAGNGTAGFSGDGGSALSASLYGPSGIAFDPSGNMHIGDSGNSRVRKVDTAGVITTVAGNGSCTFNGDGVALQHSICAANSLATDLTGNIFVADANRRVRVVDRKGNLRTIAGNGTIFDSGGSGPATQQPLYIPSSIAVDPAGSVYVSACYGVRTIDLAGNISALGKNDGSCQIPPIPTQFAVDASGRMFFARNNQVLMSNSSGKRVVVAGTGVCLFDGDGRATQHSICNPEAVLVDAADNVYIADTGNNLVRKVDTAGNMTTIAGFYSQVFPCLAFDGDGPATSHSLCTPWGLTLDAVGNVYVADSGNNRVRMISQTSATIATIAGNGMTLNGQCLFDGDGIALQHSLCNPIAVAFSPFGDIVVSDLGNLRVRDIDAGNILTIAGNGKPGFGGDGGPSNAALLTLPLGLAIDSEGAIYVADAYNNRVRRLTLTTVEPNHDF